MSDESSYPVGAGAQRVGAVARTVRSSAAARKAHWAMAFALLGRSHLWYALSPRCGVHWPRWPRTASRPQSWTWPHRPLLGGDIRHRAQSQSVGFFVALSAALADRHATGARSSYAVDIAKASSGRLTDRSGASSLTVWFRTRVRSRRDTGARPHVRGSWNIPSIFVTYLPQNKNNRNKCI